MKLKRFAVESIVLLAVALTARFIAEAGHPALAMFILAADAAVLIYLSQEERFKREEYEVALRRRLDDAEALRRRLSEALVGAACEALWVSHIIESADAVSYVIETPESGRLVINLPVEENDKTEDAETDATPATSEKG